MEARTEQDEGFLSMEQPLGTHDELLAQGGFYHNLCMSQFKGKAV